MRRRHASARGVTGAGGLVVAILLVICAAAGATTFVRSRPAEFYLVLGASAARGFQPVGVLGPKGRPMESATGDGYASDVVAREAAAGHALTQVNVACSGETVVTMLDGGDACFGRSSQLDHAVEVLREHEGVAGIVSVDVGFNDLRPCLSTSDVKMSCVNKALVTVRADLPPILARLRDVAGSRVTIVGLTYGDPFLGHYVNGVGGPSDAFATESAMVRLDGVLTEVYDAAHVRVARVADALELRDRRDSATRDGRRFPVDVAVACRTTFECRSSPWGPDDHPNDHGYEIIARSIVAALPADRT